MTNRSAQREKHGFGLYFNDLAVSPDEGHGQALATVKKRLCGAYPATGIVAIAGCLTKALVYVEVGIKGSVAQQKGVEPI